MQKTVGEVVTLIPIVLASYLANRAWVFHDRIAPG